MEPFDEDDENIDDLFNINDEPQQNTAPIQPQQQQQLPNPDLINNANEAIQPPQQSQPEQPQQAPQSIPTNNQPRQAQIDANPLQQQPLQPIQEEIKSAPPQQAIIQEENKNEFIMADDLYEEDDNKNDNEQQKLDLPIVNSLQPDELVLSINDTINKMSQLDPKKQAKIIMAYKANLVQQLEKLQNISKAIDSLNNMEKTAESLPKNPKTGYPDIESINLALREHCFFAEQVNVFGMLLIEIYDYKKLREAHGGEYTDLFMNKLCDTITKEFVYSHLLFHYQANRLVVLVYIENEEELMVCGKEIIRLLTTHSYEVKDQSLHSTISVGAAIFEKKNNRRGDVESKEDDDDNQFDFRTWMKNAELGLNKANNSGLKNQCCITKETSTIAAIIPSMNDNSSGSHGHKKSTLSLLARTRGHSSGGSTYNKLKLAEMQNNLSPQEIRASIRLYDKLSRIKIKEDEEANGKLERGKNGYLSREDYKLVALSLCRRLKEQGANYNFQHPKHNGNSILMLCCERNFDIIIKYFCIKLSNEDVNFNLANNDGNNALMIAILNKNITNDIIKLIAAKTTDKMSMNHEGKTAKQLAEQMGRNELIPLLNTI